MAAEILLTLLRLQLVVSAAIALALLLRRPVLRWCGAGIAYRLWLIVPLAAVAALLPARERLVMLPAAPAAAVLQATPAPAGVTGIGAEHPAASPAARSAVPSAGLVSGLLLALWLLGAFAFLTRSILITRRLAASPALGPALIGVWRPRLVLPPDFEIRFDASERALILAHEEMHRVSRHAQVNALVEVVRCASWFNPLAHWAAARFRADQEIACDMAVITAHPGARRAYAEALLKAQVSGVHLPLGCVWTSITARRLAERIARLSERLPGRRRRLAGATALLGVGMAAGYVAWAQQPAQVILLPSPVPAVLSVTDMMLSKSPAAEFATETVDEAWSTAKRAEIITSLAVLDGVVSTAQVDCRSSSCRVQLQWDATAVEESADLQEQRRQRITSWARDISGAGGFLRGDTSFPADRSLSLSYFTTKSVPSVPASSTRKEQ